MHNILITNGGDVISVCDVSHRQTYSAGDRLGSVNLLNRMSNNMSTR